MSSHLAICDGDGLPLWMLEPTRENVPMNTLIGWMDPYVPCVVVLERRNGTCLVAYDGIIAYAVTECLYEVL
jgi:hypothetical protein